MPQEFIFWYPHCADLQNCCSSPRFTVSLETASFLASSGILEKSWNEICAVNTENKGPFLLNRHEGVVYLSFSSLYMEVRDGKYEDCNIQSADFVSSPSLKGDNDQPALVHKGAFNRFQYILENTDLKAQVQALREKPIIFGGYSIGGAVATLATLWFLGEGVRSVSAFCITFGSPLVGDAKFGQAIVRQDWCGRFCHVVSQHDIVPRMLFAPFQLIAETLNAIAPHLGAGLDLPTQEASRTLVNHVLQCTDSTRSLYRPSGTYMFCSLNRATCIDDSEAALKILHYTPLSNQGLTDHQILGACISGHTSYGELLKDIVENMQNSWEIANIVALTESSFEMGIALTLGAIGIGVQNAEAVDALRKAGEMKNEQDMNIDRLNFDLSLNQSYMASIEWYKLCCRDRGYYDCFKDEGQRDIDANLFRAKLESFWDDIIEMVEKHQLPSDFQSQNKWINAGNAYRKLVEPLDIAFYYQIERRHGNRGNYLSAGVRHHRHEVLEKWMKEKDRTRNNRGKKARTKFASITEDSCFWAHVEEALKSLQYEKMNAQVGETLEKFEDYVWTLIQNRSISDEVFLEGSSFMEWWRQYRKLRYQSEQWQSSSPLFNFMTTEGWKAVGI